MFPALLRVIVYCILTVSKTSFLIKVVENSFIFPIMFISTLSWVLYKTRTDSELYRLKFSTANALKEKIVHYFKWDMLYIIKSFDSDFQDPLHSVLCMHYKMWEIYRVKVSMGNRKTKMRQGFGWLFTFNQNKPDLSL